MRSGVRCLHARATRAAYTSACVATVLLLSASVAGCIAELDEGARAPRASLALPSRIRVAVCEAVVAAAQNGVRPSSLEVELPVDGTEGSVALRFEGSQLPQASQCADVVPAAAMLPVLPTPTGLTTASVPPAAPATPAAPAAAQPSTGALEPYIPSYPTRTSDPLNTRR
jgi:hypothetical protein